MNSTRSSNPLLHRLRHWSAVLFSVALVATGFAQSTGSVSGTVTDRTTNAFLVGAEVRLAGTELVAATARDGTFTLANVPAGQQSLEVSYVGRKTKTVPIAV